MDRLLWTQIGDFGPSLRLGAQMSYDSARDRIVLFGGDTNVSLGDTWEFDGNVWEQVADFGPPGRAIGGMCYDQGRKKTVLFGGELAGVPGDPKGTWEWDGQFWVQVADSGPTPQNLPICYDATNKYTMVVSRADASGQCATWSWDGTDWEKLDEANLGDVCLLAYDPVGKQMLLCPTSASATSTYGWTGSVWKQLSDIGPTFSYLSSYPYSDGEETLAYYPNTLQTWSWSGKGWLQRQNMGPAARTGVSISADTKRNRMILFGGSVTGGGTVAETWALQRVPLS
jgi:hypothetical protein